MTFILRDANKAIHGGKKTRPLAASSSLPRYFVLKSVSNSKFVRPTNDGYLRANGEEAASPDCKFEFEMAKNLNGFVNIRSCYNNKYWVPEDGFLKAAASVPNEDQTHLPCTMFEPVHAHNEHDEIQLRCVHSDMLLELSFQPPPYDSLLDSDSRTSRHGKFKVIDWESLLILPRRVVFKGNNGHYLRTHHSDGRIWLKFNGSDVGDSSALHVIFNGPDGAVRIWSESSQMFWCRHPDWILADSWDESDNNKNTLFMPVRAGGEKNSVALRCLGNNAYVKRLSHDGKDDCLNAAVSSITEEATLIVEEPVLSRTIFNVKYRLEDARIYDENVVTMVSKEIANYNTQSESQSLRLKFAKTTTSSFHRSVSVTVGVTTTFSAGIPSVVEGELEISVQAEGSMTWSDATETSSEIESTQVVTVPPMSKVTLSALATRGKYSVPFSYSQRDVLTNGETVIYEMDDGIYNGTDSYKFTYRTDTEPL